ncbi:MAG: ThiF family adenylyltransferase [Verrucomicrobiota bacterium]
MAPFIRHYGMWSAAQQRRLGLARVAVGGVGGVGSTQALLLAKAGIGQIRIADRDNYEVENVVEQAFATWDAVGLSKVEIAKREMVRHQAQLQVEAIQGDLAQPDVAAQLVLGTEMVFSAVDNPAARIALGRAALDCCVPFVVGANVGWSYFHTIYIPELGGYAANFRRMKGIRRDPLGFPVLADADTRVSIERDWCIWTVAFSGFRNPELRRFIRGDLDHFAYAAGPAFAAASASVSEGLKCMLHIGSVAVYPDARVIDLKRGGQLTPATIRKRYAAVAAVWDKGERAILGALEDNG